MEPKDLKSISDRQKAYEAEKQAASCAEDKLRNDLIKTERAACRKGLEEVALPYLREIEADFGKDHFSVETEVSADKADKGLNGVSFRIDKGASIHIQLTHSGVTTNATDPNNKTKDALVRPVFVGPGGGKATITGSKDITRENIGPLVRMAIEKS